ncbi:MAG TPA: hypothetical protein VJ916_05645 [Anaerovoracaceae bacterium]|nr:hypothetical protein [Anaerovoracaceae bacterium]
MANPKFNLEQKIQVQKNIKKSYKKFLYDQGLSEIHLVYLESTVLQMIKYKGSGLKYGCKHT